MNYAPQWSGGGSALYQWPVGNAGAAFVRGDAAWHSRVFFTVFNTDVETQGPLGLAHVRAGFAPRHRRWDVAFYVRNLTRQPLIVGSANLSPVAIGGRPGEPRHWGTELTVRR